MIADTQNRRDRAVDPATAELVQEAVHEMNAAVQTDSTRIKKEIEAVEKTVVRLRDHLIGHLRRAGVEEAAELRPLLEQVNVAVSLVVSIEYPAGGIHREALEEARDVLAGLATRTGVPASA